MTSSRVVSVFLPWLALVAGCDNVGRAFDPNSDPDDPVVAPTESIVQVVPVGGDAKEGRPKVRTIAPEGPGWPTVVPVVIEFTESVNEDSIAPADPTATDARIILRIVGTTQAIPCQYDFLAGGRLLVMRPVTALANQATASYEVVLLPDARDSDGVRFQVSGEGTVLTEFQVNQDETQTDGRILATWPRDNQSDAARETEVVLVFDRPANPTSLENNFVVQRDGGSPLAGEVETPLTTVGIPDGRVAVLTPDDPFAASAAFEIVVDDEITFGQGGVLDFRGRTPFARFQTVGPAMPTGIELGNPATGFPNKINRGNVANAVLRVTTPDDTVAGDRVRARIYGGDATTTATGDRAFVERTAEATQGGQQTVDLDFSGALGSLEDPDFDDGAVTFAAQMLRGSEGSGFAHQPAAAAPRFDVTPPTLQSPGPPASADGLTLFSDVEYVNFYGRASEAVAAADLVIGANPAVAMFASDDDGRFIMLPVPVGRQSSPVAWSLTLTDRAGNMAAGAATGNVVQRGFVVGTLTDTLVVEAYDQTTLLPIAGASVLVDIGTPTVPASAQRSGTTAADGRAAFSGLSPGPHTVTIVRAGFDLVTMYATNAAFVSLPLTPATSTTGPAATATFKGNVAFTPTAGFTAVIGNSAAADRSPMGIRTTNAAPNTIPPTPIVPNRPQVVTGFAGVIEPATTPSFGSAGCQLLGPALTTTAPPAPPTAPGAESSLNVVLVPAIGTTGSLLFGFSQDFGTAVGLDLGNLIATPRVRVTVSLLGFEGQVLTGLGTVGTPTGTTWPVNVTFSLPIIAGLAPFAPLTFVVSEAQDTAGRISRVHGLLIVSGFSSVIAPLAPPAVPVVTTPGGAANGSPLVQVADVLDPAAFAGSPCTLEVTATDSANRRWVVFMADRDATGGTDDLQLPDLATANVAGLAAGTWNVRAEARLWLSATLATPDDFMLTERTRSEASYARSAVVAFTVQ